MSLASSRSHHNIEIDVIEADNGDQEKEIADVP
jgi:hypothetical protein